MIRLKKFNKKETNNKNTIKVIGAFMLVGILLVGISYAVYQQEAEVTFINAKVGNFKANDIELAIKLDGEEVDTPPEKNSLYTVTVDCDNATGTWDMEEWGPNIRNITVGKVICEVNFSTPAPTLSEVTATPEKTSIVLSYTAGGIGTNTTCKWGTEEGNYSNIIEGVTNVNCSIIGLSIGTTYYYQVCATNVSGEVCKDGSIKIKLTDVVEIGDYISMTPTSTSYTLPNELSGCTGVSSTCIQNEINPSELNLWRVIKKNDDGTVEMISEYVSSKNVYFYGKNGYMNLVGGLNAIAAQYTNTKYVIKTRYMGYSNQTEICTTISTSNCPSEPGYFADVNLVRTAVGDLIAKSPAGVANYYFLPSRSVSTLTDTRYTYTAVDPSGTFSSLGLYTVYKSGSESSISEGQKVRPVITVKSDIGIINGDGKSAETAYTFE